jgi:hypothetical protein
MNNKKQGGGFFGALMGTAAAAGNVWRETVKPGLVRFGERANELRDGAGQVRVYVNSFTPQGREVTSRWEALQVQIKGGLSAAVTGIQGIAGVTKEVLAGMDQRLALCLLEVHKLDVLATPKEALGLLELTTAKAHFEALKAKLEADAQADVDDDLQVIVRLFTEAREAIKKVPASPGDIRSLQRSMVWLATMQRPRPTISSGSDRTR